MIPVPFGFGFREPAKATLRQPFECTCTCHPILERPKVFRDRRCEVCWQDSAMTWTEFLSALDDEAKLPA